MTTVAQLKRLIETLPDDTVVLVPGGDHSLREAIVAIGTALAESRRQWAEDYGEAVTPEAEYGKRVPAMIIS